MSERIRLSYEVWRRRERGESLRSISRAIGIARKTVRRMLREVERRRRAGDDALVRLQPQARTPRQSKLDVHRSFIAEQLHLYPDLHATRLHEKLTERGFDGGYTIVRELLKGLRPKRHREEAYELVTTAAGQQAQVDWSPYKLANGTTIYCFSCVLGHSRYLYACFCLDMRQPTIFRQLRRAFDEFGGVPHECVFDTMPGIIDRWEANRPIFNLGAVDFALYMGFELHASPRRRPQYKGKIERPYRYIEESLLNGRTFYGFEEAQGTLRWWLDQRANVRTHRTTKRVPLEALAEDRACLKPIPAHPYDDRDLAHRVVDSYGYVAFDGNHYHAPCAIGEWVYVRASEAEVSIAAGAAKSIATHPRAARNAGLHVPPPIKRPRRRPTAELLACLEGWSADARRYGERLRQKKRYGGAELAYVCDLQKTYAIEDILAAMSHGHRYGAYGARQLERILELRAEPRTCEDRLAERAREHVRQAMNTEPVRQRSLVDYGRLLGASREQGVGDEEDDT